MSIQPNRRRILQALSTAGLSTLLASNRMAIAQSSNEKVAIVIIGCGLAGLASAHRLRRDLPKASITLIDAKKEHNYQPGYTLLATGVWKDVNMVKNRNERLIPSGANWIQSAAKVINADNQTVETESGQKMRYDFLVVSPGLTLRYDQVEGLDVAALGQQGLGSVYHSPEVALKTWHEMDAFRQQGGRAVMTLAPTAMKCAGAPLKMAFMLADRLRQAGQESSSSIDFFAPKTTIFGVPSVNDNVLSRWENLALPIAVHFQHTLQSIDMESRQAIFSTPSGRQQVAYDFIHIVPPMTAPTVVLESDLIVTEGKQQGWLAVDKATMQHTRHPNIFGLGDINGTPKGKTAATVKKSAPVMVNNLLRTVRGQTLDMTFDGYTSCPMLLREGAAMLVEFNYAGELTPTIPMVDPLQGSYFAWYIEEVMLKPAYMSVLKGNA